MKEQTSPWIMRIRCSSQTGRKTYWSTALYNFLELRTLIAILLTRKSYRLNSRKYEKTKTVFSKYSLKIATGRENNLSTKYWVSPVASNRKSRKHFFTQIQSMQAN